MSASFQNSTQRDQKTTTPDSFTRNGARDERARVDATDALRIDHDLATIDLLLGRQIDTILHHPAFQTLESAWRGLQFLVDRTDLRRNVRIEVLDVSKETLRQDFEDAPELIQSGLFLQTYTQEYDTPGAYPFAAVIANYEFDASAPDIALLRNLSKVAAAAHMPFIGAVSPEFFGRTSMEEVAGIRDLSGHFERAMRCNRRVRRNAVAEPFTQSNVTLRSLLVGSSAFAPANLAISAVAAGKTAASTTHKWRRVHSHHMLLRRSCSFSDSSAPVCSSSQ
ncbi:type VI secretion system ImpC/EvpB family protein [Paraburkholderia sp. WSM4175]